MITEIRRGMNVKRYHHTDRVREETVGHHSANVCAIILRLDPDASRAVLIHALLHDVEEGYTGDIPYPVKRDSQTLTDVVHDLEDEWRSNHDIPSPFITLEEVRLLKLADMLDLVLSSLEEVGRGNSYAKELVANGQAYITGMDISTDLMAKCELMVREVKAQWQPTTSK